MTIDQSFAADTLAMIACEAALAAGTVAREGFLRADPATLQTQQKAGFFDIVTACDKAAEKAAERRSGHVCPSRGF